MYSSYQDKINMNCKETFSPVWIILENFMYFSMWIAAGWIVLPIQWRDLPLVTILWAGVVILIQVLLKKHNCSGCYYYGKPCHLGWGKLSGWLFKQDSGNLKTGMGLSLFYIIIPPVILVSGILTGILIDVTMWHWCILGVYLFLNVLMFPVRKKGCRICALRDVCHGSAAKSV